MKTSMKILITVIIIAAVSIIGILWGLSSVEAKAVPQPQPSPTPEILENGWYRFTDPEAGYSFDYPPQAVYISYGKDKGEKYNHVFIDFVEMKGSQSMILVIQPNPKKLSVEEFLTEWYSKKTKKTSQPSFSKEEMGEFFSVDGEQAIRTELIAQESPSSYSFHVIFVNGDKVFITGLAYSVMKATAVTPEAEELFTQILNTFTFIP